MATLTQAAASIKSITTHYIDGAFVESHGQQVTDIIRPTDGHVIGRVTLADEEGACGSSVRLLITTRPARSWGGFKFSGVGREYGRYGIEAFLETRAILES